MSDWKKVCLQSSQSIFEAIKIIDKGGLQIAVVLDESGGLLGTVTDGDVRRGVLNGISLEAPVSKVMKKDCLSAKSSATKATVLKMMKEKMIHQIPIVDEDNKVIRIEVIDDLVWQEKNENVVVLMAGGRGRRLAPLTDDCPKPLLKVGEKPILEWILENFVAQGFQNFQISVNYMAEKVEKYFGDGSQWGVKIDYLREDEELGTAGALGLLKEKNDLPIIVMNGDLLTNVNFEQMIKYHEDSGAVASMCVRQFNIEIPYGVVQMENHEIVEIEEKPVHQCFVNSGIYVLNPEVLDFIPKGRMFNMTDVFALLREKSLKTCPFPLREYWLDIGRQTDFKQAQTEIKKVYE